MKVFMFQILTIGLEFPSRRPIGAFATADDVLKINGVVMMLESTLVLRESLVCVHIEKLLFAVELCDTQGRFWGELAESIKGSMPNGISEKGAIGF